MNDAGGMWDTTMIDGEKVRLVFLVLGGRDDGGWAMDGGWMLDDGWWLGEGGGEWVGMAGDSGCEGDWHWLVVLMWYWMGRDK